MFKSVKWAVFVGFAIFFLLLAAVLPQVGEARPNITLAPDLGTAANFAVLAASAVNDSNPSTIIGDVGLSPAAWPPAPALTCLEVTGTIYSVDASGPLPCRVTNPGLLTTAKNDLTTAYNDAAGRPATTIATELGGQTLVDGVYTSAATTFEIVANGTLTLDGAGNADSVFIFQMASDAASLVTGSNSNVVLINDAQACNVFWQVGGSATLGTGTNFIGNVMADQSITDNGGSTVNGRFLARIAAVTLNNTTISRAECAAPTPTSTLTTNTASPTPTETRTPRATRTRIPTRTRTTAPTRIGNTRTPTLIVLTETPTREREGHPTPIPFVTQFPRATPTEELPTLLPTTGGSSGISLGSALMWFALASAGAALVGFSLLKRRR